MELFMRVYYTGITMKRGRFQVFIAVLAALQLIVSLLQLFFFFCGKCC
jgi:hypothetical protein